MTAGVGELGPVRGRARIDILDILRGIAILGILYMNIPFMATNVMEWMNDPRRLGWDSADVAVMAFIDIFWAGTQRGLFEMLFGAGVLIFTAKAMKPDDPVVVADLYFRRNLLLVAFGLIDIFVVLWIGDILLCYGLAALFVFAFRKAPPKALLALGVLWAVISFIGWPGGAGLVGYQERAALVAAGPDLQARKDGGAKLTEAETATLEKYAKARDAIDLSKAPDKETQGMIKAEDAAHRAGVGTFILNSWATWQLVFVTKHELFFSVVEAVCAMFIGMALFKLGVIQGQKSAVFYAGMAAAGYLVGCGLRAWAFTLGLRFDLSPNPAMYTHEAARLAVTLGHIGLFNLMLKFRAGAFVLAPFKATGRMAFSVYVLTSIVTLWIVFAPWGLDLWGVFGWAEMALVATLINLGMIVFANVWLCFFVSGPLEWIWRSLTYWKRQPLRRSASTAGAAQDAASVNPLPA